MRQFSLARTIFWLGLTFVAWQQAWLASVVFVSLISIWALVETAFAAWRSDVNPDQKEMLERLDRIEKKLNGGNS